ncbi:phenylalanine--tRNA ligase subunit beta [Candidatus Gottesmanbacteria bacterium]|nr:phenylalanine--tRNA ligase subunit beta [Candidatus Gottesmanbacteria bacterium]
MNIRIPHSWLTEYIETDAKPQEIKDYLSLCGPSVERISKEGNEFVYDIEITSNRVDSASVYGIAREAAAILPRFGKKAILRPLPKGIMQNQNVSLPLSIKDPQKLCDRLLAVVLDGIVVSKSSEKITQRLKYSGIRSLNNVVDITNYIMLELGHPCHVFDYDRIKTHTLILRFAKNGETLTTLDGKVCTLTDVDVVIDDGTGQIIDLPGIMGTENSVVTEKTKRVIFFIESNNPSNIRRTSMRLSLRTYAATLNEKRPDPELAKVALEYGATLLDKETSAKLASTLIDIYPHPSKPHPINISESFIASRLGIAVSLKEIIAILQSLHFNVEVNNGKNLTVIPPSFRQFDVTIPEDIVEEVARIYGYHNLPGKLMEGKIPLPEAQKSVNFDLEEKAKTMLKFLGFTETYSYSFISKTLLEKAGLNISDHLRIANPLTEDTEYMRRSVFPSLFSLYGKNMHARENVSLFELANVYTRTHGTQLPSESLYLTLISSLSFRAFKGVLSALLEELGLSDLEVSIRSMQPFFHPHQSGQFVTKNPKENIAFFGTIHPNIAQSFLIPESLQIAEIYFETVVKLSHPTKSYNPIPMYPSIVENITVLKSGDLLFELGSILKDVSSIDAIIKDVTLLDMYNEQSLTFQIVYQHESKNLSSKDVLPIRNKIIRLLESKYQMHFKS